MNDNHVLFGITKIFLRIEAVDAIETYYLKETIQMQEAATRFQKSYYRYKKLK